jgi:hypothetical protein
VGPEAERVDLFRRFWILLFGLGGAYGAYRVIELWARQAGNTKEVSLTLEATPFIVLICIVGALLGSVIGSLFLPTRR